MTLVIIYFNIQDIIFFWYVLFSDEFQLNLNPMDTNIYLLICTIFDSLPYLNYFPGGFLNELKRDLHAAYKHYSQAYNLLMEVRATDTNIMEVKTVGGFINYKMCKLAFALNLPRDAISQFRRQET